MLSQNISIIRRNIITIQTVMKFIVWLFDFCKLHNKGCIRAWTLIHLSIQTQNPLAIQFETWDIIYCKARLLHSWCGIYSEHAWEWAMGTQWVPITITTTTITTSNTHWVPIPTLSTPTSIVHESWLKSNTWTTHIWMTWEHMWSLGLTHGLYVLRPW